MLRWLMRNAGEILLILLLGWIFFAVLISWAG